MFRLLWATLGNHDNRCQWRWRDDYVDVVDDDDDDVLLYVLFTFGGWISGFIIDATDVRLCFMWLWTRSEFTRAAISDSSPAITVAQTIFANDFELSAGVVGCAPRMPNISKHALWPGKPVPPPTISIWNKKKRNEKKERRRKKKSSNYMMLFLKSAFHIFWICQVNLSTQVWSGAIFFIHVNIEPLYAVSLI